MPIIAKLLILFAVSMPAVQSARYGVHGQVTLEGVTVPESVRVYLEGLDSRFFSTAYTNSAGRFQFMGVPQGTYYIVVAPEGFEEARERIVLPQLGSIWIFVKRAIDSPPDTTDPVVGGRHSVDVRQLSIPQDAVREYEKAQEELEDGNTARAMERLRKAVNLAPRFYEAAVELARLHIDRREYDAAVDVLRSDVPVDSTIAGAAFYLGYALYNLGQYDAAEKALLASLESDSNRPSTRLVLANIFIRQAEAEKALQQIDAYLEENPDGAQRVEVEQKRSELMQFLNQ